MYFLKPLWPYLHSATTSIQLVDTSADVCFGGWLEEILLNLVISDSSADEYFRAVLIYGRLQASADAIYQACTHGYTTPNC